LPSTVILDGSSLTIEDVVNVARNRSRVEIASSAIVNVESGRRSLERIFGSGKTVYGINTGFGKLSDTRVPSSQIDQLQLNLIRSHAVGTGMNLTEEEARAVMIVRLNSLLLGNSGVRVEIVSLLGSFLNQGIFPVIPRYGSLGASGDLAPSAHLALCLIGEGFLIDEKGRKVNSRQQLRKLGLSPIRLKAKEGLAIINGTQVMTGLACLLVQDAIRILANLDIASALSLEALGGSANPLDPRIQKLRPLNGQSNVASSILKLVKNSKLIGSSKRVQDPYSLRCIPQVHGAFYDSLNYVKSVIQSELNSVTDNPIIFPETDEALSSGNFHGQPVAIALDLLGLVVAEAAVFSERRIDKLLSGYDKRLTMFLSRKPGLNSGLMVTQYTAASLVVENKILAKPASLESVSVSAGQEDHASMGVHSALKAREILEHTSKVIAIEMLCASQAIDMLGKDKLGEGTLAAYKEIRELSKTVTSDRSLSEDIDNISKVLKDGTIQRSVERKIQF
jgi:histidine ammonia-lyase